MKKYFLASEFIKVRPWMLVSPTVSRNRDASQHESTYCSAERKKRRERKSMAGHRASKKHVDTWAQGHCVKAGKGRKWSGNH